MKTKKTVKKAKRTPPKYYGDEILKLLEATKTPLSVRQIMAKLRIRKETFKSVYRLMGTLAESPLVTIKTEKVPSKHGPRTTVYSLAT